MLQSVSQLHQRYIFVLALSVLAIGGCSERDILMPDDFAPASLVVDGNSLVGNGRIAWLNDSVEVIVARDSDAANVSPLQRKVLGSLVKLPISKRTQLEKFLASHYQAEVFGTLSGGEAVTPKLSNSSEIWRLIRSPVVCVPLSEDIDDDCKFSIGFECNWDPEHGIEIRFDSNDAPVEVGSQGDFF